MTATGRVQSQQGWRGFFDLNRLNQFETIKRVTRNSMISFNPEFNCVKYNNTDE